MDGTEPTDLQVHHPMLEGATVIHLKPADVLLIGNVGNVTPDALQVITSGLREKLGVNGLVFFPQDITLAVLRTEECPYCRTPDEACPVHRAGTATTTAGAADAEAPLSRDPQ